MNKKLSSHNPVYGKHDHPFPLELVANVAVRVLLAHKDFEKQPPYEEAVDVAVQLLQACQNRLAEVNESIQAEDRSVEDWEDPLRESHREQSQLEQKFGNPVPFLKGLFYITKKRSRREALPPYTWWLLYYRLYSR